jgi:hypothetical protein
MLHNRPPSDVTDIPVGEATPERGMLGKLLAGDLRRANVRWGSLADGAASSRLWAEINLLASAEVHEVSRKPTCRQAA